MPSKLLLSTQRGQESGVSTEQAVLYTTTFPCHECAKIIIGAGIREVHYIEPFPKSLVDRLYGEMIDTSPVPQHLKGEEGYRIPFYQFVGIAPRRFGSFFIAGERKIGENLVVFDTRSARPRIEYWNDLRVSEREAATVAAIDRLVADLVEMESERMENEECNEAAIAESDGPLTHTVREETNVAATQAKTSD